MVEAKAIERDRSHRSWMPSGPWIMVQSWCDLLFAHWPVPTALMRELVPPALTVDEFGGSAWLGLTPFRLTGLRPRGFPAIPGTSEFLEMNLRTYVRVGDKPGIWFFSLEASSRAAVIAARTFYRLPYRLARMSMTREADGFRYESHRVGSDEASLAGRYRPVGAMLTPAAGSLEHFLTERYAFYVVLRNDNVLRGDVHHRPWTLRAAEAVIELNTVPAAHGLRLPDLEPVLHFAARQDTLIWPPRLVG